MKQDILKRNLLKQDLSAFISIILIFLFMIFLIDQIRTCDFLKAVPKMEISEISDAGRCTIPFVEHSAFFLEAEAIAEEEMGAIKSSSLILVHFREFGAPTKEVTFTIEVKKPYQITGLPYKRLYIAKKNYAVEALGYSYPGDDFKKIQIRVTSGNSKDGVSCLLKLTSKTKDLPNLKDIKSILTIKQGGE